MAARVQITVEAKDAASGILRGITSQFGALGGLVEEMTSKNVSWGNVATMATTMVINGLKDAYKVTQEYAGSVRDLALVSGTGAEESSRLLQVLDDFEISAQDVTAATRIMTKQGLTPTIDTLAKLSDQYLEINDAQERNEFITKNLGRAGLQWVNVLKEGGDALRAQGDAVSENLILNDEEIRKLEEVRLAQDAWNDTIQGTKVQLIVGLLPALDAFDNSEKELALSLGLTGREADKFAMSILSMKNNVDSGIQSYTAWAQAIGQETIPALESLAVTTQEVSAANMGLLSLTGQLQSESERFTKTTNELQGEMAKLDGQVMAGTITQEEYIVKTGEVSEAMRKNGETHTQAGNKIAFSLMQQKLAVDGLSEAEFEFLLGTGVQWGIFDETVAKTAMNMDEQMQQVAQSFRDPNGAITTFNEKLHNAQKMSGQKWEYFFEINVSGSVPNFPSLPSGSGGSGGKNLNTQSGGAVYAGQPRWVGEAGAEPFVPAQNGRILGHAESLHAMSLGAGGGIHNVFYGNVSIDAGSKSGEDILSLR